MQLSLAACSSRIRACTSDPSSPGGKEKVGGGRCAWRCPAAFHGSRARVTAGSEAETGILCLTLLSVGCVSSRPLTSAACPGKLIQQTWYQSTVFPRDDRIAGRRCSQRNVLMGQGWDCECLQALKVIGKPEAPALPLLQAELGKLWRCYASIFLAGIWVRIPFPAGCSWADEPWRSLLPGTWR